MCMKGLEQRAPDGSYRSFLGSHEASLHRKEMFKNTTFQCFILANVARNLPSLEVLVQVPSLAPELQFFLI